MITFQKKDLKMMKTNKEKALNWVDTFFKQREENIHHDLIVEVKNKSVQSIISLAEKLGDIYFICGEGGEKDQNNLPDRIHICPAYGVDWFQIYERTDKSFGPEW